MKSKFIPTVYIKFNQISYNFLEYCNCVYMLFFVCCIPMYKY